MAKLKTLRERMRDDDWPEPAEFQTPDDAIKAYESGYEGCFPDPDGAEECEAQEDGKFADAAYKYGIAGSGAGKLSLAYPAAWKVSGRDDWYHGSISQPTGDCVGRGCSHALIGSLANAVLNGNGSWPQIPDEAYRAGMPISPVGTYWCKHGGVSGWSCGASMARAKDTIGFVVGCHYDNPNIGDLMTPQKYSTSTLSKYCRSGPPEDVVKALDGHKVMAYSRISSFEECCDSLANGYCLQSCGGEGFSKTRDEWGVSKRSGHWSHAIAVVGADATEEAKKRYNTAGLLCFLNSWGTKWIGGPRTVHGKTDAPQIPSGAFWATWESVKSRDYYSVSSIAGFPAQRLPEWNLRGLV